MFLVGLNRFVKTHGEAYIFDRIGGLKKEKDQKFDHTHEICEGFRLYKDGQNICQVYITKNRG